MILAGLENIQEVVDMARLRIVELANEFLQADREEKIVILKDEGIFVGMVFEFDGRKIATDVLWFVKPEFRKNGVGSELLDAFEFWASKVGATMLSISTLNPSIGGDYFEKKGYSLKGLAYFKELNNGNS